MTQLRGANVAASVRQRLLDQARSKRVDFNLLLTRYGLERFLYRLGRSEYRERFVLKGAMLFTLWGYSWDIRDSFTGGWKGDAAVE